MAPTNRFGPGFLPANAGEPASGWCQWAKTQATPRVIRPHLTGANYRINSCCTPSRVETIIPRRSCVRIRSSAQRKYHYCSINPERRNSENCCRYCGNPATWLSSDFRILLKDKHLDLFQNGPRLAKSVAPAQVHLYWCPDSLRS
jgi:hypothetical protein